MADWFTPDGAVDESAFANWTSLREMVQNQDQYWTALESHDLTHGAERVVSAQRAAIRQLQQTFTRMTNSGQSSGAGFAEVKRAFDSSGPIISTAAPEQKRRQELEKAISLSGWLVYAGLKRGTITFADLRDPDDIKAALWDIAPGLTRTAELADFLARERENTRRTLRDELARLRRTDAARLDEWEEKLQEAKKAYVGWARRRSTRWRRLTRSWEERHRESERRIRSVEETYKEQMGLKAPVDYWNRKADQHRRAEFWTRLWVMLFFPAALAGLAFAFNETAVSLIQSAQAAGRPGAPPFPTAIFIVASAGLASCAGLVFWVGRLLTKLYLSQHHLRQDAEERATMTETYLALIENSAASTEDRQVILNALFRNTPDGIVKEEGGLDPSIAAALGKFLARQ